MPAKTTGVAGVRFQIEFTRVVFVLVFAGLWTMLKIAVASSEAVTPAELWAALNKLVHAEELVLDVFTQVARILASVLIFACGLTLFGLPFVTAGAVPGHRFTMLFAFAIAFAIAVADAVEFAALLEM